MIAEDRVYAVFNMRLPSPYREKWNDKLLAGNWSLSFTAAKGVDLPSVTAKAYEIGRWAVPALQTTLRSDCSTTCLGKGLSHLYNCHGAKSNGFTV